MMSSTVSSESAPRSSTNDASAVTSSASTPSCSTMIDLTLSSTDIDLSSIETGAQSARCVLAQIVENQHVKRMVTYEEAAALRPEVEKLTQEAVSAVEFLTEDAHSAEY